MDPNAHFWQVQAGKLPKPMAAQLSGELVQQGSLIATASAAATVRKL